MERPSQVYKRSMILPLSRVLRFNMGCEPSVLLVYWWCACASRVSRAAIVLALIKYTHRAQLDRSLRNYVSSGNSFFEGLLLFHWKCISCRLTVPILWTFYRVVSCSLYGLCFTLQYHGQRILDGIFVHLVTNESSKLIIQQAWYVTSIWSVWHLSFYESGLCQIPMSD